MRFSRFYKLLHIAALLSLLLAVVPVRADEAATPDAAKLLPERAGDFLAQGATTPSSKQEFEALFSPEEFGALSSAERLYIHKDAPGATFRVTLIKTRTDAAAYSIFTNQAAQDIANGAERLSGVGTAAIIRGNHAAFFKGSACVFLEERKKNAPSHEQLSNLARQLAGALDAGENEIPVLVKHLPEWETAQNRATFVISPQALKNAAGNQPVLDALSFEGGAQAVTATYGPARLVIVESTTPQLATSNDARINAKLKELRDAGQPLPTAYRRVGNYSVFVFDAPDEATAVKLIESIKYEQVVQWLGQNPYAYQRAVRQYTNTTAGVILAVLKASGLSLLLCLGVGAVFGGLVFRRRRQQQTEQEAFSDAGGMVRLNLDEMTQYEPGKLLGPGEGR
ncbi:MAG: hypothetical protein ICV60_17450 [Pyrinomonadaceae bacterium]|nr:hypothetical protein [Pyrinomonadaceae bacterium]